jgi:hypothetical protein
MFVASGDPGQGSLFTEVARLSEVFYEQLRKHPVPMEEAAIRAISNNSVALDLYAWLAYRLHALSKPTPVSWAALKGQFGAGVARMDNFRATFLENLGLALAVYRNAKVEVGERGVVLHPSQPPVAPRSTHRIGLPAKVPVESDHQSGAVDRTVRQERIPAKVPATAAVRRAPAKVPISEPAEKPRQGRLLP